MKDLPVAARWYVVTVCVAGAVVALLNAPHSLNKPGLFLVLLFCSSVASALKVSLPLATHGSTMSMCGDKVQPFVMTKCFRPRART